MQNINELIIVTCHACFKDEVDPLELDPLDEMNWILQDFQKGEVPCYVEHMKSGIELLAKKPSSLLVISGGFTRRESGQWSEAMTYLTITRHFKWWGAFCENHDRIFLVLEEYSRDSFENLFFSICQFRAKTGCFPKKITLLSWEFKRARFQFHRETIRYPQDCFCFVGAGQPPDLDNALEGERKTLTLFQKDPFGKGEVLTQKRQSRNPQNIKHGFTKKIPKLQDFLLFLKNPQKKYFSGKFPWE